MAERPDLEVVGAVHSDRGATAFKIAQVLSIPTHTEVESLRSAGPDLVVVADDGAHDWRRAVLALGLDSEVLTTREAAHKLGLLLDPAPAIESPSPPSPPAEPDRREPSPMPPPIPPSHAAPPPAAPPAAIGTHGAPHLELMLRDEMEELLGAAGEPAAISILAKVLSQVASAWADLLGAEACAIGLTDPDLPADLHWVAGGSGSAPAGFDSIARETLATGVPVTYVRHEGLGAGEQEATPLRQAIAAFPLESVAGVVWFRNVRLPGHEVEERLQVLRRAARRLGRVLGLATRVVNLERERDDLALVADLALATTNGTGRDEVVAKLKSALASALAPSEIVFRFESGDHSSEDGPPALRAIAELLAPEVRRATMPVLAPVVFDGRPAHALAGSLRHRGEHLGMVVAVRPESEKGRAGAFTAREIAALDRLLRHAAPALAGGTAQIEALPMNGVLDRRALENLVAGEVRRSDRYGTPLLLTVLELEAPAGGNDPDPGLMQAFPLKLKARLRDLDRVATLGPGKIAVLCPHTDRQGGRVVMRAKEVLAGITSDQGPLAGPGPAVRGNQVQYPGDAASLEELLTRLGA
ncbi:MAG TPA: hypothetical protein VNM87_14200 [Candidatus Udaeobacter sp.]|nr:hypothetical protein [Candidatus Udaeobacter sp.]